MIADRNRTRKSVGVTSATKLVWFYRFTGTQPSHLQQQPWNQKDALLKICKKKPPYSDWGPTPNQSWDVIKMSYTNMYSNIIVYIKYLGTSIKVSCATRSLYASLCPKAEGVRPS